MVMSLEIEFGNGVKVKKIGSSHTYPIMRLLLSLFIFVFLLPPCVFHLIPLIISFK